MLSLLTDTIVSLTDFRKNLTTYINRARRGQPISVTDGKKADLLLVKRDQVARLLRELARLQKLIEELESIVETHDILSDPEMMDKIRRSEEDIAAGRTISLEELEVEWGLARDPS